MTYQPSVILASVVGAALSGTFIGCGLTLSYMSVPSLLVPVKSATTDSREQLLGHAARQWQFIYDIGAKVGPVTGAIGSSAYVLAARGLPATATTQKRLLFAAAVANVCVGPFTMLVMARTNNELMRRASAAKSGKAEKEGRQSAKAGSIESYETTDLLQRWARLNAGRVVLPLAALVLMTTSLVI